VCTLILAVYSTPYRILPALPSAEAVLGLPMERS
jgi:hypothetical protein